jgi:ATP-dependent helicase/nuclease subunit A
MSEKKWTEEQELVIRTGGRDLLVSAAAGSGKTAVLVERIIRKILSKDHPIDVDRLLVVTFTKAAAGEMKQRIREAIEDASAKDPDNLHLRRQRTLIGHAKITTIDSFCSYIIRNHFDEIGLDPSFRTADQTEVQLLGQEVMDQVFASHYEAKDGKKDTNFLELIRLYGKRNKDQAVMDLVKDLYQSALSFPWPEDWLKTLPRPYEIRDEEDLYKQTWFQKYFHLIRSLIQWAALTAGDLAEEFDSPGPFEKTAGTLREDQKLLEGLYQDKDIKTFLQDLSDFGFPRLASPSKKDGFDPDQYEGLKALRKKYKDAVTGLQKKLGGKTLSDLLNVFKEMNPVIQKLVDLTIEYHQAFMAAKQQNHIMDFSDMEHYALEILVNRDGSPRPAALEFQKQYEEVMIDEYQDSNEVQELLLSSISRASSGQHNYFMVGDVKQSIYRFRQARPEIFMGKYKAFSEDLESPQVRIDLTKNFRSRREVLEITNDVFSRLMSEDVGGVSYEGKALLNYGAVWYPEGGKTSEGESLFQPEILVGREKEFPMKNPDIQDKEEYEALMIASRISRLLREGRVTDSESGGLRSVRPGDIAILLRKKGSFPEKILETLKAYAIPARLMTETSYFDAPEVDVLLSFLTLIDNPLQDIPMAAVLHSAMFHVSDDRMAEVREKYADLTFAEAVISYAKDLKAARKKEPESDENSARGAEQPAGIENTESNTDQTREIGNADSEVDQTDADEDPVLRFYNMLERYRKEAERTPLFDLIQQILDETGFLNYSSSLPGGDKRRANLEKLVDLAVNFENGAGHSVFSFMQYIRKMKKYNLSVSAPDGGSSSDTVSIMTIHNSKGLEFPIVILAAAGNSINKKDSADTMIQHPSEGMALTYIHGKYRRKKSYLYKDALSYLIQAEAMGEELRILYVAMTRAKEKLIITGMSADEEKDLHLPGSRRISSYEVIKARSYLDWICMALSAYGSKYKVDDFEADDLIQSSEEESDENEDDKAALNDLFHRANQSLAESIQDRMAYIYPKDQRDGLKMIYSVSELKHRAMEELMDQRESEEEPGQPADFLLENSDRSDEEDKMGRPVEADAENQEDAGDSLENGSADREGKREDFEEDSWEAFGSDIQAAPTGALRGTAMHRFLEVYDFTKERLENLEEIRKEKEEMLSKGLLTEEEGDLINEKGLLSFLSSDLAERMHKAAEAGTLHRESPFVLGVDPDFLDRPADLLEADSEKTAQDTDQLVMVQGTIDAWFIEGDEIVLVDYKTDRVRDGEELLDRYKRQLEWYALALTKASHRKIREACLYSLYLQVEVPFYL